LRQRRSGFSGGSGVSVGSGGWCGLVVNFEWCGGGGGWSC
jgi:hypothetical protein